MGKAKRPATDLKRRPPDRYRQLTTPEAESLAELFSRHIDLLYARDALDALVSFLRSAEPANALLVRALWASAVAAYGRCFKTGKLRTRWPDLVAELISASGNDMHVRILWRRDKEVGHAVESVFDDVTVAAVERSGRAVGLAVRSLRVFSPSVEHVQAVLDHITVVLAQLSRVIERERAGLLVDVARPAGGRAGVGRRGIGDDVSDLFGDLGTKLTADPLGGVMAIVPPRDAVRHLRRKGHRLSDDNDPAPMIDETESAVSKAP